MSDINETHPYSSPETVGASDAGVPVVSDEPSVDLRPSQEEVEALMASPGRFVNRELSWLGFNSRVLEETENANHPLLERLRFLSISASNLDEFFHGARGRSERTEAGGRDLDQRGWSGCRTNSWSRSTQPWNELVDRQQACFKDLRLLLEGEKILLIEPKELTDQDMQVLEKAFLEDIFPVLTPLAVDPAHPFPFIPILLFAGSQP